MTDCFTKSSSRSRRGGYSGLFFSSAMFWFATLLLIGDHSSPVSGFSPASSVQTLQTGSRAFSPLSLKEKADHLEHGRRQAATSKRTTAKKPDVPAHRQTTESSTSRQPQCKASPSQSPINRRNAVGMAVAAASFLMTSPSPNAANAYNTQFPVELTDSDRTQVGDITLGTRTNSVQRAAMAQQEKNVRQQKAMAFNNYFNLQDDLAPSLVWSAALWLLSGSRSNPLVTSLANLVYDAESEPWLKDRNNGLFASPPVPFLIFLGILFVAIGFWTEFVLLQITEGDSAISLQLAGVSLIWGGFYEIGRIASNEKRLNRDEYERDVQLQDEFKAFAEQRLQTTGNCHRSDVVAAFRRFNPKYRQADNEDYPLTDLEIERLLRWWNGTYNQGRAEMTSAGFYYGLQINSDADAFR